MIKILKKFVLNKLSNRGYFLFNRHKGFIAKYDGLYLLLFALGKKDIKIIQVGANDGKRSDPLYEFNKKFYNKVQYIGIEPQEEPFGKLKETYRGFKNFNFIKGAVGKGGIQEFYYFNDSFEKYCKKNNLSFSTGTNSLIKNNLTKRLIKHSLNPDLYISKFNIETYPLYDLIKKNNFSLDNYKDIDLLQVDAEGYDDEVIYNSQIDFFKPRYINFEHKNLDETKLNNLLKFLEQKSYVHIMYKKNDCLAVLNI